MKFLSAVTLIRNLRRVMKLQWPKSSWAYFFLSHAKENFKNDYDFKYFIIWKNKSNFPLKFFDMAGHIHKAYLLSDKIYLITLRILKRSYGGNLGLSILDPIYFGINPWSNFGFLSLFFPRNCFFSKYFLNRWWINSKRL